MYKLVRVSKSKEPVFSSDNMLKAHAHCAIHWPSYHPELNAIEKVKNWVAANNITFALNDVETLARKKFSDIDTTEWASKCHLVKKTEKEFIDNEHFPNKVLELKFTVNSLSSSETDDTVCTYDICRYIDI